MRIKPAKSYRHTELPGFLLIDLKIQVKEGLWAVFSIDKLIEYSNSKQTGLQVNKPYQQEFKVVEFEYEFILFLLMDIVQLYVLQDAVSTRAAPFL